MKYPSISMAGAALLHSIVHNHPFHNGNKRTALVCLLVFLDKNGYVIKVDHDVIYDFLLNLAAHKFIDAKTRLPIVTPDDELIHAAKWLQSNMKRVRLGEYPLQFRQLRDILIAHACDIDSGIGRRNSIKVTCKGLQTIVHYDGEGREVPPNAIHKLRKDLHLDELHGCDSDIFYNKSSRIPDFINKYRKVLTKLAKV